MTDPWLSPDGTAAIEVIGGDRLRLNDLEGLHASRVIELDPPWETRHWRGAGQRVVPDGARIAYTVYQQIGTHVLPSVYVVDLDTGGTRQLVGPGSTTSGRWPGRRTARNFS